ncbi:hypothetical protein GUITHDRAFT_148780 [Guillardia theta CCMP2712]|uniref:Uncharacterized protein n=1 Tax=Guillardia theta (strain CCMP2712) TaxID=905079 RepID=L1I7F1_GUITC|nr:hypothetical protein GUITHDRAFT_148780 [Guillardia theta CCMP2712]EKX32196.1 hypothetical protein GUITHDRAFT_148780 [Guillardia theta CCMP2712]|eukprot:XP_005819176.1 hypothetical protein GUITHDRAFT_148780 [Guillardia theta CCMP2712]
MFLHDILFEISGDENDLQREDIEFVDACKTATIHRVADRLVTIFRNKEGYDRQVCPRGSKPIQKLEVDEENIAMFMENCVQLYRDAVVLYKTMKVFTFVSWGTLFVTPTHKFVCFPFEPLQCTFPGVIRCRRRYFPDVLDSVHPRKYVPELEGLTVVTYSILQTVGHVLMNYELRGLPVWYAKNVHSSKTRNPFTFHLNWFIAFWMRCNQIFFRDPSFFRFLWCQGTTDESNYIIMYLREMFGPMCYEKLGIKQYELFQFLSVVVQTEDIMHMSYAHVKDVFVPMESCIVKNGEWMVTGKDLFIIYPNWYTHVKGFQNTGLVWR